ncbi:MAG: LysM peptidoglycan-binding domain-containing protein [Ardenticatenales bacterium]|nr:LysM peptidoglycan-binding domain-containing protein [Ardenticatenales bacterium]
MSDSDAAPEAAAGTGRCPVCDYKVQPGERICLMCGSPLPADIFVAPEAEPAEEPAIDETPAPDAAPAETEPTIADAALGDVPVEAVPDIVPDIPAAPEALEADDPEPAEEPELSQETAISINETPETTAPVDESGLDDAPSVELEPAPVPAAEPAVLPVAPPEPILAEADYEPLGEVVEMEMRERQAPITAILVAIFAIVTIGIGALILPAAMASPVSLAFFPTVTPLPPTITFTPTITPIPTETSAPTQTPTLTVTPSPVPTLQPPRDHAVAAGETLFSLSVVYDVSIDSITALNNLGNNPLLFEGQSLLIPYPTATPPLEPIIVEVDGQRLVADPTDCQRYEIQENDSIVSIGARFNVDYRMILAVNRLDSNSFIRPGQTLCIPTVAFFDGELPPTPGPSPTPLPTLPPAGAQLMFPPDEATFAANDAILLQWAAVQDLNADEWYLVELVDLDDFAAYPQRAYTRDNSFRVPSNWRTDTTAAHRYQWRVTIVLVVGERQDGEFIRTFEGLPSEPRVFDWAGGPAPVTPTPTPAPG